MQSESNDHLEDEPQTLEASLWIFEDTKVQMALQDEARWFWRIRRSLNGILIEGQ